MDFASTYNRILDMALVGGGNHPQSGQISLGYNGVLFLDKPYCCCIWFVA
jgi:magnesium chelatase family protein